MNHPKKINSVARKVMFKLTSGITVAGQGKKFDNSPEFTLPLYVNLLEKGAFYKIWSLGHVYNSEKTTIREPEMKFLEKDGEYFPFYYRQADQSSPDESMKIKAGEIVQIIFELQEDQALYANSWLKKIKRQQSIKL